MTPNIAVLMLLCAVPLLPNNLDTQSEVFLATLHRTYDFRPAKLTKEELDKKSKELDEFWKMVAAEKETLLPLLREQLKSDKTSAFFHFDGAKLLLEHSKAKEDFQLAADAISHAEMEGLNYDAYFHFTHFLATEGVDVTGAVEKILDTRGFEVFIVEHVLTLGQDMCCLYCTLPMKEDLYVEKLIARLKKEKDPSAVRSILICLQSTITEKARKAMQDFAKSTDDTTLKDTANHLATFESPKNLPAANISAKRELFSTFIDDYVARRYDNPKYDFETYEQEAPYLVLREDYAKIKEMRRKRASRVSDEALGEIEYLTRLIQIAFTSER